MNKALKESKKIKDKSQRMTKQRKVILEELREATSHPSADEIFHMVRRKISNISFATVYRNLKVLKRQGLLIELDYSKTFSRFDSKCQNHYHFRCLQCNRIFDIEEPVRKGLDHKISQKMGFQVSYHRLEFYGRCKECQ